MPSALDQILLVVLYMLIFAGGFSILIGGPGLAGKMYRGIWRHVVERPLHRLLRWMGRQLRWLLLELVYLTGRGLRALGRAIGHGLRALWVRLTA